MTTQSTTKNAAAKNTEEVSADVKSKAAALAKARKDYFEFHEQVYDKLMNLESNRHNAWQDFCCAVGDNDKARRFMGGLPAEEIEGRIPSYEKPWAIKFDDEESNAQ